ELTKMAQKKRNSVTLTDLFNENLDILIRSGFYIDKPEAIRDALRDLFEKYGLKPF
ncbi:unnamed protein product, partial [marine sediment metagenome]